MFEAYIANLRKQLDNLGHEKVKLESDLHHMTGLVEDFKTKWVELRFLNLNLLNSKVSASGSIFPNILYKPGTVQTHRIWF